VDETRQTPRIRCPVCGGWHTYLLHFRNGNPATTNTNANNVGLLLLTPFILAALAIMSVLLWTSRLFGRAGRDCAPPPADRGTLTYVLMCPRTGSEFEAVIGFKSEIPGKIVRADPIADFD